MSLVGALVAMVTRINNMDGGQGTTGLPGNGCKDFAKEVTQQLEEVRRKVRG